ncbi:MAG: hypothetical protein GQ581_07930 [Methyloprofundus sp.]|nr:hypothetical protein [Methyloprofundus sp.]
MNAPAFRGAVVTACSIRCSLDEDFLLHCIKNEIRHIRSNPKMSDSVICATLDKLHPTYAAI